MSIQNIADWQNKTDAEVLAELLADVFVPTNAVITIGKLRDESGLTPQEYGQVRGTLDNAIATLRASEDEATRLQGIELSDALGGMLGQGISLSIQSRQTTIDVLAQFGQWSNELRDKIKALGGVTMPRWQSLGMSEPTIESVSAERQAEAIKEQARQNLIAINQRRIEWDRISLIVRSGIETDAIKTVDQIIDKIESEWGI
jgi:hypothetical protein